MNILKKLIIYNFQELYNILNELKPQINYELEEINTDKLEAEKLGDINFDLILAKKKISNIESQLILKDFPIKLSKLVEKINIEILKNNFQNQSEIKIGKYNLNLNSRVMSLKDKILKLTEKESNIILYLYRNKKPISINQLQDQVWGYQSDLETHTVETHIYRLRKKILEKFADNNFIVSTKQGYKI